ncbi:3-oxoacyl-ACP synthase III family protein [Streptomyces lunalinharesii]|uniref:Anthraniloyl-CoA anthraniloyltransferase n=1 Tax=Streptomyces lunalinharesii TaxID=333384 RepID=A0ABN3RMI9_9ACTN
MIGISSLSYELGSRIVSNTELALSHGLPADELVRRTGIETRRQFGDGEDHFSLTVTAVTNACTEAGIDLESTGDETLLIYIRTGVPTSFIPPDVVRLAARLGMRHTRVINLEGSCVDLVTAMDLAHLMIESGRSDQVIIAAGMDPIISDPLDLATTSLLGGGAGAMVLTKDSPTELKLDLRASHWETYPQLWHLTNMPLRKQRMTQTGFEIEAAFYEMAGVEGIQRLAAMAPDLVDKVLAKAGWQKPDVDLVICHQPNGRALTVINNAIGFDPGIVPAPVREIGNLGVASALVNLAQAREHGRLKPSSNLFILTFGAGLSCAAAAVTV